MEIAGLALIVTILVGSVTVITAIVAAIRATLNWAKAQAKADLLRDQSEKTIEAKNRELATQDRYIERLEQEKSQLWALLQEKSL